jgi:hypothetical protein
VFRTTVAIGIVWHLLFVGTAHSQFNRGTVVAINISSAGTTIAADSRNHPTNAAINDDMCKIRTFGGKFTAAIIGISGHDSSNPARTWNGYDKLEEVFRLKHPRSAKEFAQEWAQSMRVIFTGELEYDANALRNAIDPRRQTLIVGVFDEVGAPSNVAVIQLALNRAGDNDKVLVTLLPPPPPHCSLVCGLGRDEIINEISFAATTRGRVWNRRLATLEPSLRAIEAVRLTIENIPEHEDVGGDIDAVLVSRTGLKWLRKKKSCRDTETAQGRSK